MTDLSIEVYEYALGVGAFVVLFDGFDEIDHASTAHFEKEIIAFTMKYGRNDTVVSSRPDERFAAWQEFVVLHLNPLDKDKTIELISKIEYDPVVKAKFIARLEEDLFDRHEGFLSNPLLATMMLLTFEQIADIPAKTHIFYEQAFETLFHRHDATKEVYARKRFTPLPIDEFRSILGAFALVTYMAERFSFSSEEAKKYLEEAFELEGTPRGVDLADGFLRDLLTSVCILQIDGAECQFSHRSFQEFFAADFLSRSDKRFATKIIQKLLARLVVDDILEMLKDMNPELVERHWVLPKLKTVFKKLDATGTISGSKFYNLVASGVHLSDEFPQITYRGGQMYLLIFAVSMLYNFNLELPDNRTYWEVVTDVFRKYFTVFNRKTIPLSQCDPNFLNEMFEFEEGKRLLFLRHLLNELEEKYARRDAVRSRVLSVNVG
jgi:hypothetical protein